MPGLPESAMVSAPTHSRTLPSTLLAHAARTPHSCFVGVWSPTAGTVLECSFAQLADCMLSAALRLRDKHDMRAAELFALWAANSVAYLSLSLGAMCVGAVSIHLNWRNPPEVNRRILADLRPRLLVADAAHHAVSTTVPSALGISVAALESICCMDHGALPFLCQLDSLSASQMREQIARLDPTKPAAVFFTGGTTGTPKVATAEPA